MEVYFETLRDRLREPIRWHALPALVASGLALVICGHLLTQMNPRLGKSLELFPLASPESEATAIYISVRPDKDVLVIGLNNKQEYRVAIDTADTKSLASFRLDLKKLVEQISIETARAGAVNPHTNTVTIAVDQHLAYYHVRPLINLIAEAGVTNYGFETVSPTRVDAAASDGVKN